MAIRITGFVQPSRQKSNDHQEDHHHQPDPAQIPGHTRCLNPSADAGRNGLAVRIDGIIQPSQQKKRAARLTETIQPARQEEKSNPVDRDRSAVPAEIG